ncbi:MAG TPA: response regulator transcription factor [Gammaproteobacteria bacterium]|nr:response regulator transcription factor [Gammaproteobacteria bacterium]
MRVLIIEDDTETAAQLEKGLQDSGHETDLAATGPEGLSKAREGGYNVMIVDRMLPGLDGLSLVRELREGDDDTPVLFLTALADVDDRVAGLQSGGDDYLAKPFALAELLARMEAIARRQSRPSADMTLRLGDLEMDRLERRVTRGGKPIMLQPREFSLLEYFLLNAGQVVTRTMLLENVWGYHFDPQTNVIDVHVSRLRSKIEMEGSPSLLHTVRGAGYCLREPEQG